MTQKEDMTMPSTAIINRTTMPKTLNNFNQVECVRVTLTPGIWMLHGKIEITNWDGDPQTASADLIVEDQNNMVVDHAALRIPGGAISQTIYLQAIIETVAATPGLVKVFAATFNGMSSMPTLIATSLDSVQTSST
jgi:hypothetical protein